MKPAARHLAVMFAASAAVLALAACDRSSEAELAKIDNQIIANEADPALTSALEDQILVDPALAQQSNRNAVRPPETPTQAQYPLPRGGAGVGSRSATVQRAGGTPSGAAVLGPGCEAGFDYNMEWARRLPPPFAVFPRSRITDAAGNDADGCRVRVVTFTTAAPPQQVLGWYRDRVAGAGYSAEHQMRQADHVLAGSSGTGGAYYLILTPVANGGSEVALIAYAS